MISADLLTILCCPENHQTLTLAEDEVLAKVNARMTPAATQPLLNRGGQPVLEPLVGALVRLDRSLLYPVRDGIPILLVAEAIFL